MTVLASPRNRTAGPRIFTVTCPNCGSTELRWYVGTIGPHDVPDGRIRMSEVSAIAYLACEECSETLTVVREDEINQMLNKGDSHERCQEANEGSVPRRPGDSRG